MATEFIVSKSENNELGIIGLSTAVFESIAEQCLEESDNARLANSSTLKKGITCKVVKQDIVISLNVLASTGVNIADLSRRIQNRVYESIVQMTGFKNIVININIVGFYYK